MSEPLKRIVLTRFWVGDTVYHLLDGSRGLITAVQLNTDRLVPRYNVVFDDRKGEMCDEMEITAEKIFNTTGDAKV